MKPLEKIRLSKALTVCEATKYGETWVGFPYNRHVSQEEITEARQIKRNFVMGLPEDILGSNKGGDPDKANSSPRGSQSLRRSPTV